MLLSYLRSHTQRASSSGSRWVESTRMCLFLRVFQMTDRTSRVPNRAQFRDELLDLVLGQRRGSTEGVSGGER